MPRQRSLAWSHFEAQPKDASSSCHPVTCKWCKEVFRVSSGTRLWEHLAQCKLASSAVRAHACRETGKESKGDDASAPSLAAGASVHGSPMKRGVKRLNSFVDSMSDVEQKALNMAFARAVFSMGLAFHAFSNKHFLEFMAQLRPSFKVPSPKMLGGSLLADEDERVQAQLEDLVSRARHVSIVTDGWTDRASRSIINFMVVTDRNDVVFWKAVDCSASGQMMTHTAENLCNLLKSVVDEVGADKVKGVVSDNAANVQAAFASLVELDGYKHIFPVGMHVAMLRGLTVSAGCACHGLSLLIKDILRNAPFEAALTVAKEVSGFFRRVHAATAILTCIKNEHRKHGSVPPGLTVPCETRWGSHVHCIRRFFVNREFIQRAVIHDELPPGLEKQHRDLILDKSFWNGIEMVLSILNPIANAIVILESDRPAMHLIVPLLETVDKATKALQKRLTTANFGKLSKCIAERYGRGDATSASALDAPQI